MKNIYLIAEAHLDPMWLWRWEEGYAEALSTFRTAVELMDEFPEFEFCHNESVLYEWIKEADPALFHKIQEKVKEGRWHIPSGWFLQPDCNMPSGESIVRNILHGRRFFRTCFPEAAPATTAINFDSFGHSKGLVQILTQAGYDAYLVCRPGKEGFPFVDQDFIWEGFHGTRIRVHRSDENYNSVWGHAADELRIFLEDKKDEPVTLFLWGVGDHGGGATREDLLAFHALVEGTRSQRQVPTPENLVTVGGFTYSPLPSDVTTQPDWANDLVIRHSSPEAYFKELAARGDEHPVVSKGLNPVADGCYTSQIQIKQRHRALENALYAGEKMAVAAQLLTGIEYPAQRFAEAERSLLFAEFHDGLPGSGSPLVEEDTLRILDHGLEIMAQENVRSFTALTVGEPRIQDGTSVIQVYNPHPFDVEGDFACECGLPRQNWTTNFLYPEVYYGAASDHPGESVPSQADKEVSNFSLDWRKKVVVHATLKAGSVTRFDVHWKPLPERPRFAPIEEQGTYTFDNPRLHVAIDTTTGLLSDYTVDGRQLLGPDSCRLVLQDDGNNPWGLHSTNTHLTRTFQLLTPLEATKFIGVEDRVLPPVRVVEDGDVHTVVEALFGIADSKAYVRYILPKNGTAIDVEAGLFFAEKQQMVRLVMNHSLSEDTDFLGQVMFGRETLAVEGQETVSQKWLALADKESALAVYRDGGYGASLKGSQLALTLLRGAGYTASDFVMGKAYSVDQWMPRMEQGMRYFRFRLDGGNSDILKTVDNRALVFQETPYALALNPYGGGKKPSSFYALDNLSIVISAFKPAADGNGYILRVYETTGSPQEGTLDIPSLGICARITLEAEEVKTYRVMQGILAEESLLEGF